MLIESSQNKSEIIKMTCKEDCCKDSPEKVCNEKVCDEKVCDEKRFDEKACDEKEKQVEVVTKQPGKEQDDLEDVSLSENKDGSIRWGCATCMVCVSDILECSVDIFMCCVCCGQDGCTSCMVGFGQAIVECFHPCGFWLGK